MSHDDVPLVAKVAKAYVRKHPGRMTLENAISAGNLGLCKAVEKWQEGMKPLRKYAASAIRREICEDFRQSRRFSCKFQQLPEGWGDDDDEDLQG